LAQEFSVRCIKIASVHPDFKKTNHPLRSKGGHHMNRRVFLAKLVRYGLSAGALSALPVERVFGQEFFPQITIPIIDPHAHIPGDPYLMHADDMPGYTLDTIRNAKLCATTMAAIGDNKTVVGADSTYIKAKESIATVRQWETQRIIKIIRRPSDIPLQPNPSGPIPVFLAIEGGDAIGNDLGRLSEFYSLGVRMITLVHGTVNQSGDNLIGNDMRQHSSDDPNDKGLTDFGCQVVRRMNRLGMVVDVAHASTQTVLDVASCTRAPIVDSHTSMLPPNVTVREHGRQRLYSDAEAIATTGGVVCTYPYRDDAYYRVTLDDWVEEINLFKSLLGIEHIGFGTDSGGGVPRIPEWTGIGSVKDLETAMRLGGLRPLEISAFTGLNFLRVFTRVYAVGQVLSFLNA
jgi:membrane dipeptidase